jgi:hypothetical protein
MTRITQDIKFSDYFDCNTTKLTAGRYTGLEAYLCDDLGVKSTELITYYDKWTGPFSAKGSSSSMARVDAKDRHHALPMSNNDKEDE